MAQLVGTEAFILPLCRPIPAQGSVQGRRGTLARQARNNNRPRGLRKTGGGSR